MLCNIKEEEKISRIQNKFENEISKTNHSENIRTNPNLIMKLMTTIKTIKKIETRTPIFEADKVTLFQCHLFHNFRSSTLACI